MAKNEAVASIRSIEQQTPFGSIPSPEFSQLALNGIPIDLSSFPTVDILGRKKTQLERREGNQRKYMRAQLNMASVYEGLQRYHTASERVLNLITPLEQRDFLIQVQRVQESELAPIPLAIRLEKRKQEKIREEDIDPRRINGLIEKEITIKATRDILKADIEADKKRVSGVKNLTLEERLDYYKNFVRRLVDPTYQPLEDHNKALGRFNKVASPVGKIAAGVATLLLPEFFRPTAVIQIAQNPIMEALFGGLIPKMAAVEKTVPFLSPFFTLLSNRTAVFLGSLGLSMPSNFIAGNYNSNPDIERSFKKAINNRSVGMDGNDKLGRLVGWTTVGYFGLLGATFLAGAGITFGLPAIPIITTYVGLRSIAYIRLGSQIAKWMRRTNADALRDIADARDKKNGKIPTIRKGTISELVPTERKTSSFSQKRQQKEETINQKIQKIQNVDLSAQRYLKISNSEGKADAINKLQQEHPYDGLSKGELQDVFEKKEAEYSELINKIDPILDRYLISKALTLERKSVEVHFDNAWAKKIVIETQRDVIGVMRTNLIDQSSFNLFTDIVAHMFLTNKNNEENITVADIVTNPVLVRKIDAQDLLWMTRDWTFAKLWPAIESKRKALLM